MPGGHSHRSGGLRQSNKKNKRSNASKRSVAKSMGGRVNAGKGGATTTAAQMAAQTKADRRNHQQQKRDTKRQALLRKKRGLDNGPGSSQLPPPRVVGIISLGNPEIEERVRAFVTASADRVVVQQNVNTVTCKFDVHKKDGVLTVLTCSTAFAAASDDKTDDDDVAVMAALDLARVCDTLLFCVDGNTSRIEGTITDIQFGGDQSANSTAKTTTNQDWDHLISERGDRILASVKGQGLPTPITVLAHTISAADDDADDHMTMQSCKSLRRSKLKRQLDLKKYVSRFATTEFGSENDKVVEIDLSIDANEDDEGMEEETAKRQAASAALVRTLCTLACHPAKWVANAPRAYVLTDTHAYDAAAKQLRVTGHVRGVAPFDVNSLVHVPGVGTFACQSLQRAVPPLAKMHQQHVDDQVVLQSNPEQRESLHMYAAPDSLEGEQNLIGFDEEGEKDEEEAFARPAGWSDYQSAWLDAVEEDAIDVANQQDYGELAEALNSKKGSASIATDGMDLDDANEVSTEERRALMEQRKKQQSDENDFPDEVQVHEDEKARERFARYRSLNSFRKSHWDPKENLPDSFASIYHFSSFKQTQRSVMNDMKDLVREAEACNGNFFGKSPAKTAADGAMDADSDDDDDDFLEGCIPSGSYVTLTLEEVPNDAMSNISANALLTAVSLLPHENKVSVLHMGLSQSAGCDSTDEKYPIKSKDVLTFRCGWRTWKARPVFSQNNLNCDKHKFERFLPTGGAFFAASVFGPVTYTPCPILVFRERDDAVGAQKRELVAVGSMMGADADRIVVKRIVLTGYPVRVHKRHATVKYMFYDPEDVKWFKPAGLHTKHGLQGNIIQSVGEHGTMKCLFNAPIKQHDTVCLPLYKRIYPKYAPVAGEEKSRSGSTTYRESSTNLVVL
jgi:pre-rRNA-processing protein TSR1